MGLEKKLREDLQYLARIDPRELQAVLRYARWRRFRYSIAVVAFPAKVAIIQTLVLFFILAHMPFPLERPTLALVVLWAGSFCLGFMAATLLPGRRVRIHWVS